MHIYGYIRLHMNVGYTFECVQVCMRIQESEEDVEWFLSLSTLFPWDRVSYCTRSSPFQLGWLLCSWDPPVFAALCYRHVQSCSAFYMGVGYLNSGPHTDRNRCSCPWSLFSWLTDLAVLVYSLHLAFKEDHLGKNVWVFFPITIVLKPFFIKTVWLMCLLVKYVTSITISQPYSKATISNL